MLQVFLIVFVLIAIAFIGLGFNIFFRKSRFPETEIGHNKKMRELGLTCVKCDEMKRINNIKRYKKLELDIAKINL